MLGSGNTIYERKFLECPGLQGKLPCWRAKNIVGETSLSDKPSTSARIILMLPHYIYFGSNFFDVIITLLYTLSNQEEKRDCQNSEVYT